MPWGSPTGPVSCRSDSARAAGPSDDRLTFREQEVVELLATGRTNRQIADRLHVSVKTVERHLSNLYRKLGVSNRTEAATTAIRRIAAR